MASLAFAPSKIERLKELTRQLTVEEDYLMSFFQVCPDMLCILDHDKCIKHLNDAWEKILGYSRDELVSQSITALVSPFDLVQTNNAIKSLQTSKVVRFYNKCKTKSGELVPLEWNVVLSEDGFIYADARSIPHECIDCERARQALYASSKSNSSESNSSESKPTKSKPTKSPSLLKLFK